MHSNEGSSRSLAARHSYEQTTLKRLHNSSSFVLVNNKRSWRPPPSLVNRISSFFPDRAPLAFITSNPGVRLYTERSARSGFAIENYSIGGTSDDWNLKADRDERLTVEADREVEDEKYGHLNIFPYGTCDFADFKKWRDHPYPPCGFRQRQQDLMSEREVSSCGVHPAPQDKAHSTAINSLPDFTVTESNMCFRGPCAELSLCIVVRCDSFKGLSMALHSSWWLSRYFGISLVLQNIRGEQANSFLQLREGLCVKGLRIEKTLFTEHWLQAISNCSELLSLAIINCNCNTNIELRQVNPILSSNLKQKQRDKSSWFLAGLKSLGLLHKLRCLHLSNTSITPEFLLSVAECKNLQCIIFQKVKGFGSLKCLASLPALCSLGLQSCFVEDDDVAPLADCKELLHLFFDDCRKITRVSFLTEMEKLTCLSLCNNNLSEEDLACISTCSNLVELHLNSLRRLTKLGFVEPLKKLDVLSVPDTAITLAGSVPIRLLDCLTRLNLSGCRHVSSVNVWLDHRLCSGLVSLDLSKTNVEDNGIVFLNRCRFLRYLDLSECPQITSLPFLESGLVDSPPLASATPPPFALRWLSLHNTSITDEGIQHLSRAQNLRLLCLKDCGAIASLAFAQTLQHLKYLDLGATGVDDDQLQFLNECQKLKFLSLAHCTEITSLVSLHHLSRFTELDLSHTNLTDKGLLPLSQCHQLECLFLRSCTQLTHLAPLHGLRKLTFVDADRQNFSPPTPPHLTRSHSQQLEDSHKKVGMYLPSPPKTNTPKRPATSFTSRRRETDSKDSNFPVSGEKLFSMDKKNSFSLTTLHLSSLLALILKRSTLTDPVLHDLLVVSDSLVLLDLHDCALVEDLSSVKGLKRLRLLNLSGTAVNNQSLTYVGQCGSLEKLTLTNCSAVTSLNGLGPLHRLKEINVSRTRVTGDGLTGLSTCRALTIVRLSECRYLTDLNAFSSLQFLTQLYAESTPITADGVKKLSTCKALQKVYFTKCSHLNDLGELVSCWPQLEVLDTYGTAIPSRTLGQPKQCACTAM